MLDFGIAQEVVQQLALVKRVVGPVKALLDVVVGALGCCQLDALGLAHHAHRELLHTRRKGRAEHHGLCAVFGKCVDFGQILGKAQVEHAIGFVDHQVLNLVQADLTRLLQVEQAAGGRDDHVCIAQAGQLMNVRGATNDAGNTQTTAVRHQVDRIGCDLLRQFACWTQNQSTGCCWLKTARCAFVGLWLAIGQQLFSAVHGISVLALCSQSSLTRGTRLSGLLFLSQAFRLLLLEDDVQHGQQEGGGFTATGLAGHQQIDDLALAAVQRAGNSSHLNFGGLGETQVSNRLNQLGRQAHIGKCLCQCDIERGTLRRAGRRITGTTGKARLTRSWRTI